MTSRLVLGWESGVNEASGRLRADGEVRGRLGIGTTTGILCAGKRRHDNMGINPGDLQ